MTFHFCNVALQWTTIQAQQICYGKAPTLWSKKMKSSSQIATLESARIAKRLYNHWKHKFEVAESEQDFKIFMPTATVTLTPFEQHLDVYASFWTSSLILLSLHFSSSLCLNL